MPPMVGGLMSLVAYGRFDEHMIPPTFEEIVDEICLEIELIPDRKYTNFTVGKEDIDLKQYKNN